MKDNPFAIAQTVRTRELRPVCHLSLVRTKLDKEWNAFLDEALKDPTIASATITTELNKLGHAIRQNAIARHRPDHPRPCLYCARG